MTEKLVLAVPVGLLKRLSICNALSVIVSTYPLGNYVYLQRSLCQCGSRCFQPRRAELTARITDRERRQDHTPVLTADQHVLGNIDTINDYDILFPIFHLQNKAVVELFGFLDKATISL